ncbi:unnamed protein product [Auanema sp. JU1783]|nr:unnamed protein product [Auanema sp. JU1783]
MSSMAVYISSRGVRSLHPINFRAPWPFVKKGAYGQRKIGPMVYEKNRWPGPNREFPELSPKWHKENPAELHRYTGVQEEGYLDAATGKFVSVPEMKAELVVPDLEGFKLLPYVSYKTDVEIEKRQLAYEAKVREKGSEALADLYTLEDERWPPPKMSARTLFELHYGDEIREAYKIGRYGPVAVAEEATKKESSDKI